MERRAELSILVLTLQRSAQEVSTVLDRYEAGEREQTFPNSLSRALRAVEHDALTLRLPKLAAFAGRAKEFARRPLEAWHAREDPALLREVVDELRAVAESLGSGRRHRLDATLVRRVSARPTMRDATDARPTRRSKEKGTPKRRPAKKAAKKR